MNAIWNKKEVTVREVWMDLLQDRKIAYTTVMTLMHRLTEKGFLSQCKKGRIHAFSACQNQHETVHQLVQHTIQQFVDRFGDEAIAAFAAEADHFHQRKSSLNK